jgi:hypothetical protein
MPWIRIISNLTISEKEGLYRILIPASLYHRFGINPLSLCNEKGTKVARFFSPPGEGTCLVEIRFEGIEEPVYSIQLSDSTDITQIEWDFMVVNDPCSPRFNTQLDPEGKDTLFGWANRNLQEEEMAMDAGLFPGQVRKGLGLSREVVNVIEFFCRIFAIRTIRLEALFYHNAITYERYGFGYFKGYKQMKRINELFQTGGKLFNKLDGSTPFRRPEFAKAIRGRSWAIHDGILSGIDDDLFDGGWVSPVMCRLIGKPEHMITFPDPIYL